jgi:hypothetical protein
MACTSLEVRIPALPYCCLLSMVLHREGNGGDSPLHKAIQMRNSIWVTRTNWVRHRLVYLGTHFCSRYGGSALEQLNHIFWMTATSLPFC